MGDPGQTEDHPNQKEELSVEAWKEEMGDLSEADGTAQETQNEIKIRARDEQGDEDSAVLDGLEVGFDGLHLDEEELAEQKALYNSLARRNNIVALKQDEEAAEEQSQMLKYFQEREEQSETAFSSTEAEQQQHMPQQRPPPSDCDLPTLFEADSPQRSSLSALSQRSNRTSDPIAEKECRISYDGEPWCAHCQWYGHWTKDCADRIPRSTASSPPKLSTPTPPRIPTPPALPQEGFRCRNCTKRGSHRTSDCIQPCANCKEKHSLLECPLKWKQDFNEEDEDDAKPWATGVGN
ncbi:hypothetical protein B0O99DRAFT_588734 [Bisporella sp. PMI_857]|nr:hypothetical protein B0O99DRAFT_588734 [Bisporella sp. PMI_857]